MRRRHNELEVRIDRLAYGGDGVGKDASGRVVFIPYTAPGDKVRAVITQESPRFARGSMSALLEPSELRREPTCVHFRVCGGCSWQHVGYASQLQAKADAATHALRRFLGPDDSIRVVGAPHDTGWRRRARFHFRRVGDDLHFGLYASLSRRIVTLNECVQLEPTLQDVLLFLRNEMDEGFAEHGDVHMLLGQNGKVLVAIDGEFDVKFASKVLAHESITGLSLQTKEALTSWGDELLELDPGVWGSARGFAQASRDANNTMRHEVCEVLGQGGGKKLLELYAGSGNFTVPLSQNGWTVLASDIAPPLHDIASATFIDGDVADIVENLLRDKAQFDAILLDPPRAGAREIIENLPSFGANTIVYVSCDVMTLARDVGLCAALGWRAQSFVVIDTMPQTSHFEVVAVLTRIDS